MVTRDKLKEMIRCSLFNEQDTEAIMSAVDAYTAASNGAKPIVMRSVCSLKYDHNFLKSTGLNECPECGESLLQTDV